MVDSLLDSCMPGKWDLKKTDWLLFDRKFDPAEGDTQLQNDQATAKVEIDRGLFFLDTVWCKAILAGSSKHSTICIFFDKYMTRTKSFAGSERVAKIEKPCHFVCFPAFVCVFLVPFCIFTAGGAIPNEVDDPIMKNCGIGGCPNDPNLNP